LTAARPVPAPLQSDASIVGVVDNTIGVKPDAHALKESDAISGFNLAVTIVIPDRESGGLTGKRERYVPASSKSPCHCPKQKKPSDD
jgi:hypothetical protein